MHLSLGVYKYLGLRKTLRLQECNGHDFLKYVYIQRGITITFFYKQPNALLHLTQKNNSV